MIDELVLASKASKGRPQIKRQRADRLVDDLIREVAAINADGRLLYSVTKLSVFGSYLSDKPVICDLDIAVRETSRWMPECENIDGAYEYFEAIRPPPSFVARNQFTLINWPYLYILRRLKKVGRGINIHDQSELDRYKFEHRILQELPEEEVLMRT